MSGTDAPAPVSAMTTMPAPANAATTPEHDHAPPSPQADGPAIVQRGTGEFTAPAPSPAAQATTAASDAPRLNIVFDQAPIAMVVQSLLSDFANASVVVDPRTTGTITITSVGQLTAGDIPAFLQSAVTPLGLELIQQAPNAYLLKPAPTQSEGARAEVFHPGAQTHSGLVIYGLRYVSATEMARLLQPFAREGVSVQAERSREMLIISGPPDQVRGLTSTIELLDVDWLQGMSFGVVPLQYYEPEALIGELRNLFGGADSPIGSMVEFLPMPSRRAVLILAKRPDRLDQARTWIQQLDQPMRLGGRIRYLQLDNADAETVAATLKELIGTGENVTTHITADKARNALLIQSDPAAFEEIAALVHRLDAPADQVVIEATIAEVALNNDFKFGVNWTIDTRDGGHVTLSDANNGAIVSRFPGFSYGFAGNYVQATLNAIASRTNVEVISSPVIVTQDNQEATLQVGDQVPIVTQTAANVTTPDATVVNTVQYRDTGILLSVTPRIGAGGNVTLKVAQEASEVATTTTSGIDSPTIQQRRFESTVTIADGQTVALGGLVRANRTRSRAGVPVLSAIPLLGIPFRNSTSAVRRTELIVFLTPRIIRTPDQANAATDDLAQRMRRLRSSGFIQHYAPR